jgi:hypothetical protein
MFFNIPLRLLAIDANLSVRLEYQCEEFAEEVVELLARADSMRIQHTNGSRFLCSINVSCTI